MITNAFLNEYRVHPDSRTFGNYEITRTRIEEIEKYSELYREMTTKYASTFGFPMLLLQTLELTFQEYALNSAKFKPRFSELLAYSYYSIKRGNRLFLVLVILRYLNLISHNTLLNINSRRKRKRINDT